jgi:hypothetical protein
MGTGQAAAGNHADNRFDDKSYRSPEAVKKSSDAAAEELSCSSGNETG